MTASMFNSMMDALIAQPVISSFQLGHGLQNSGPEKKVAVERLFGDGKVQSLEFLQVDTLPILLVQVTLRLTEVFLTGCHGDGLYTWGCVNLYFGDAIRNGHMVSKLQQNKYEEQITVRKGIGNLNMVLLAAKMVPIKLQKITVGRITRQAN